MKFATLALVAIAAAQNPGRDRKLGETCAKDDSDRCVDANNAVVSTYQCCNIKITLVSTSDQTVCVDTTKKDVTIADGTGLKYGFNCNYTAKDGAFATAVSATIATISALYLAA